MPLEPRHRRLVEEARRAILATLRPDGRARLVPVCYAVLDRQGGGWWIATPLDEKPKRVRDVRRLARVRDLARRPGVTLLIDRWSEDWRELAWLRLDGRGRLLEPGQPGHSEAVEALTQRYPQYRDMDLPSAPLIAIEPDEIRSWEGGPPSRR